MSTTGRFTKKQLKRVLVSILGFIVLLLGVVTIFTPGPAVILIPTGLAILATQFQWARRLLNYALRKINAYRERKGKPPVRPKFLKSMAD